MKKRTWIFLIVYLLMTLWPVMSGAQPVNNPPASSFAPITPVNPPSPPPNQEAPGALSLTPPDTDLSMGYLSNIFGTVDGVLSGTGSQLLGAMFGIFNGAVLVLGGIVILYTLFVSTIKTAHEGEVLGKQWSSVWIPLRSVFAIALLIPKASGYSFIQILMMWVVVMGIGAADSVWNTALNYFLRGGILMQQNTSLKQIVGGDKVLSGSANLLRMLTCTQILQNQIQAYQQSQVNPNPPAPLNFIGDIQTSITNQLNSPSVTVYFPISNYMTSNGICGMMTWSQPVPPTTGPNALPPQLLKQIQQSRTNAVQAMVSQLYPPAIRIVMNDLVDNPKDNRIELGHILNPGGTPLQWGGSPNNLLLGSTLSNAASSYFGIMAPTLNYIKNYADFQGKATEWIATAQSQGWILAGSYYYQILKLNKSMALEEQFPPTYDVSNLSSDNLKRNAGNLFPDGPNSVYVQRIDSLVNGNANYEVGVNSPFIKDSVTYGLSLSYGQIPGSISGGGGGEQGGVAGRLLAAVTLGLYPLIAGLDNLLKAQQLGLNPIISLAQMGAGLVDVTVNIFLALALIAFAAAFASGLAWGFTIVGAIIAVLMPILALFSPVLLALLVTGLISSLYIPIVPFIIFTFGAIGWMIAVIEAIIAAPMVALGIAHPEGQEILGKAEPAVGLLTNVFLRPTFMIFGLLIGMMLAYVGIWLLNAGFSSAYAAVRENISGVWAYLFSFLGMYVIYVLIVMQIVQKSFTLIYIIPDEVLKWIGVNIKGMGGEAEAERAVAGGAQSAAEKGGQVASGGQKAGGKAGAAAANQAKKSEETPEISSSPSSTPSSSATQVGGGGGAVNTGGGQGMGAGGQGQGAGGQGQGAGGQGQGAGGQGQGAGGQGQGAGGQGQGAGGQGNVNG